MNRLTRVRASRDQGAYAVLYAMLVVALVGTASIVVDLATMREGRTMTRSAADSAATAAAAKLNGADPVQSNPLEACKAAWLYLRTTLITLPNGSASCTSAGFPTQAQIQASPCVDSGATATAPKVASYQNSTWTVRITWPVAAGSTLMTKPDTAPAHTSQNADLDFDGASQCARIAVEVFRVNTVGFAGVFGIGDTSTRAASVARSIPLGEVNEVIAALNILEQNDCEALITSGQGGIEVNGFEDHPGVIAVESSAINTNNSCNGSSAVIHPGPNQLTFIHANGPGGVGTGQIQSYARNLPPIGNPPEAYNNGGKLSPTPPTILPTRFGAKPILDIFNCVPSATVLCGRGGGPYIRDLRALYGDGSTKPAGFQELPNALLAPDFECQQSASANRAVVPPGNWWVNCPTGMKVSSAVIFRGPGTIVTNGGVDAGTDGCLAINVNVVTGTACPTVVPATATAPVTTAPAPAGDAILYIGNGDLSKGAQASIIMPQTFTYIRNGVTALGGSDTGGGVLLWTTPLATSCLGDLACGYAKFHKLVLWSENSGLHNIGGQGTLALRGVLFTPNAPSRMAGQGDGEQTDAQFWTRTLEVKSQSNLVMAADPDASVARPSAGVSLIR